MKSKIKNDGKKTNKRDILSTLLYTLSTLYYIKDFYIVESLFKFGKIEISKYIQF